MATEYNYQYHRISVAIFDWAESQIMRTNLDRQYFDEELKKAFDEMRSLEFCIWLPIARPYKGKSKKYAGKIYVAVQMPNGQSYGFYFPKNTADKISKILADLYLEYIGVENTR